MNLYAKISLFALAGLFLGFGIYLFSREDKDASTTKARFDNTTPKSEILQVKPNDNFLGKFDAPIKIITYSDYQCPYCVKFDQTMSEILPQYPEQVLWIYRHFPLPFHKAAKGAALAVEAAGAQGKYWEFHEKLVQNSQAEGEGLWEEDLIDYARELGLDLDRFNQDRKDRQYQGKIDYDMQSGSALGFKGTPASFLIGKDGKIRPLQGSLTAEELKQEIDKLLKDQP